MGCHPSHWLIFFRGVGIPPTRYILPSFQYWHPPTSTTDMYFSGGYHKTNYPRPTFMRIFDGDTLHFATFSYQRCAEEKRSGFHSRWTFLSQLGDGLKRCDIAQVTRCFPPCHWALSTRWDNYTFWPFKWEDNNSFAEATRKVSLKHGRISYSCWT